MMPNNPPWAQTPEDDSGGTNSKPDSFFVLFGLVTAFIGGMFLFFAISSDDQPWAIVGGIMLAIGAILLLTYCCTHILFKKKGSKITPSISAGFSGNLFPFIIFFLIGMGMLYFGISWGAWLLIILGSFFALMGLMLLYQFIESIKPNGNTVTVKVNKNTYVSFKKSQLTDEEYRDIKDSDGASIETLNAAVSRNFDYKPVLIVICIITGALCIIFIISSAWILAAINFVLFAILIRFYIKNRKKKLVMIPSPYGDLRTADITNATDEQLTDIFGAEEAKAIRMRNEIADQNKKPHSDGVYKYRNCPYCGTLNIETDKVCHSCRKKLL